MYPVLADAKSAAHQLLFTIGEWILQLQAARLQLHNQSDV